MSYKNLKNTLSKHFLRKHRLYMQATPDDGLQKVWKRSKRFG